VLKAVLRFGNRVELLLVSFLSVVFIAGCSVREELPYYHTPDFSPLWILSNSFDKDTIHTVGPFYLTNQEGQEVSTETVEGKIYVASFFFTICPGICPKLTANMARVAEAIKGNNDVLIVSHSVTPEIDSVAQLKRYAMKHDISSGQWHLVTGSKKDIYALARQSYFVEQEIGFQFSTEEFLHTEHFVLVDKEGHIRGLYNGTLGLEVEKLIEDIGILLE